MFKREASSENYGPGVYLYHILKSKNTFLQFIYFYFYFLFLFIYLSLRNLILAINRQGIDNPLFALGESICYLGTLVILCVGIANKVLRGSPTRLITLVLY